MPAEPPRTGIQPASPDRARFVIQATPLDVREGLRDLMTCPLVHNLTEDCLGTTELVLAEALNNVVEHAYASFPGEIEVQVFEAWYLAKYPEKISPDANRSGIDYLFPDLAGQSPERQHTRLNELIRKSRKNGEVMNDPRSDNRPLVLPWTMASG